MLAYFSPERCAEFHSERRDWKVEQDIGVHLFSVIDQNLEKFFETQPTAEEVRQLLELPVRLGRGQLHEAPSGPVVLPVIRRALEMGQVWAKTLDDLLTISTFEVLPTAEFESIRGAALKGTALRKFVSGSPSLEECVQFYKSAATESSWVFCSRGLPEVFYLYVSKVSSSMADDEPDASPQSQLNAAKATLLQKPEWMEFARRNYPDKKFLKAEARVGAQFLARQMSKAIQDGATLDLSPADADVLGKALDGSGFQLEGGTLRVEEEQPTGWRRFFRWGRKE